MITYFFTARGRKISYSPYTSVQEKEVLLACSDGTEEDLDLALRIFNISEDDIQYCTTDEKKALIYRLREVSVGEELPLRYTCDHCDAVNEARISLKDIILPPSKEHPLIIDKGIFNVDAESCFKDGYSDLDYDVYLKLKNNINDYITKFSFRVPIKCSACGAESILDISSTKFVLSNVSEETLVSMYKSYTSLIYNGRFSKQDIDSMYPFERTIYISQLTELIKEKRQ